MPGVWIETLRPPQLYSLPQIQHATAVASWLNRGKLVLVLPPDGAPD